MLDTPEAVFEALRENNDRPHGLQRTVTAEELSEAAEAFEEPDVLVTALLELMTAYEFTGEHRKAPVVFARLLKLWDTAPGSFSQWEAHQVFWRFKWVTTSLLQVPEVPLATVEGWIERMADRYRAADHGMQPVAAMRFHLAAHTGTGAADAFDLWVTRPRTELSDCEACETRHRAWHQVTAGDDATALESWRPVLDGDSGCTEEPQMTQARVLLPLVRQGRADEARSHHLTGYRRVRGSTGMQHEVGLHLEFCALTRNEGRGLEILAENRPLFAATGAPLARLGFLTGAEVLLARLVEEGHTDTAVAGPPGRNWTASALLAQVRAEAAPLAAAFDARNGTTAVGDARRLRLGRRPLLDQPLPLGLRSSVLPATAPAGSAPATTAPEAAGAGEPEDFVALVREARRLEALGHPRAHRLWPRVAERLADGTGVHDDRLGPEDLLTAQLAEDQAYRLVREDRHAEGVAELTRAAGLFAGLGMEWHALAARARAVAWEVVSDQDTPEGTAAEQDTAVPQDSGTPEETPAQQDTAADLGIRARVDEILREAERLRTGAPFPDGGSSIEGSEGSEGSEVVEEPDGGAARAREYLVVLNTCAFVAYQEVARQLPEPADDALERFEEFTRTLRAEAERLSVPHQAASACQLVADIAGRRGDVARAETELRDALERVEASGRPWRGSRPRALLAQLLIAKGEPAAAVELLHRALADTARHDDTEFALAPTYALLGHAALHLEDHGSAVRHLSEAAARFDRDGEHGDALDARLQLADALSRSGQRADAVAVLESLLSDGPDPRSGAGSTAASLDVRQLAQIRLNLARGLRALDEHRAAAEEFLRLADLVAEWEYNRVIHTLVAADAAVELATTDHWKAAHTAYDRAVASHAEHPAPSAITNMMCEFARLIMVDAGDDEVAEALEHLARAEAVVAAVPEDAADAEDTAGAEDTEDFVSWYEKGMVHYRRARVLAQAERFPEALVEAEAAIAAQEEGGEEGEVPRAEAVRIAALIEAKGLGRYLDAATRLTAAAGRCRKAGHTEAADILDNLRREYEGRRED
ncbi:tetratricopeptide repeat protein [Streptomyces sp. NPDC000594]|uniref:tetratricopeptide repeat protein n=1 Tax=Streptomyces sp. NPDC000594 TaxID=3154261 RepID=UPI00332EFF4D